MSEYSTLKPMPKNIKKISFVLPSIGIFPIGGFKIVYEYANRLTERGYQVLLIHVHRKTATSNVFKKIYRFYNFQRLKLLKGYGPEIWFSLNKEIKSILIPYLEDKYIPNSDFIFATEYTTAAPIMKLSPSKGKKYYFIQSLETWLGPEEEVISSWKLPMKKIVISRWLETFGKDLDVETMYIPNGLDFEKFYISIPAGNRNRFSILMLYHENKVKGSKYGLEALIKLKSKYSNLHVSMFSAYKANASIPEWIDYHHLPSQEQLRLLYNSASIFISPSLFEGFPLPPAESMMCGCALVATDIGGHAEYCVNNETALVVPVRDSMAICNKVEFLLLNDNYRKQISEKGNLFIQKFSWNNSIEKMIEFLDLSGKH